MLYLGKTPHRPGAVSWRYRDIFNINRLLQPPAVFGHIWNHTNVPMLGNDQAGDCVWATQAHVLQTMQRGADKIETRFDASGVLGDYSAYTGYVVGKPDTDKGTNMADAAKYWRQTGIADAFGHRHKIDAYAAIRVTDTDELMQATFDFGGVALGVQLPQSAMDQWEKKEPWTHWGRKSEILGGHAVLLAGRNHNGDAIIVTWDGVTAASMQWLAEYADEALAFISLDYLDERGLNPRGYDRKELDKRLAALR